MILNDTDLDISQSSFLVTQQVFADEVGVTLGVVENWIKRKYIPVMKVGRHNLVNKGALWLQISKPQLDKEAIPASAPMANRGGRERKPN